MEQPKDSVRRLVACFRDRREAMGDLWRAKILADPDVPTESLTRLELEDHVPELLDQIVAALESFDKLRTEAEARGEAAGRGPASMKHIKMRTRQGFDLAQVMRELHHLREAAVDVCESELVHFGGDAARIVHAAIDAAMAVAAANRSK